MSEPVGEKPYSKRAGYLGKRHWQVIGFRAFTVYGLKLHKLTGTSVRGFSGDSTRLPFQHNTEGDPLINSVAVIGLGAMGTPMAKRLVAAGLDVVVCDSRLEPVARMAQLGARPTSSPAECGMAEVVLVVVSTYQQVESVLTGSAGLLEGIPGDARPTVVVMSTIGPEQIMGLAEAIDSRADLVDAPFSGGALRAANGTLSVMTGGDMAGLGRARQVLPFLASKEFHCGPVGSAQVMKLINNMLGAMNSFVTGEAYRLALAHGLSLPEVADVLEASSGRNFLSADARAAAATYADWTTSREAFDTLTGILAKDVALAAQMARDAPGRYPIAAMLEAIVRERDDDTFENWRFVGAAEV
jgi:3-hydroxyisobutyrate dehydrogenase